MEGKQSKKCDCMKHCYSRYEGALESFFGRLGSVINNSPVLIIISCIFVNCALMVGFLRLESENDVEVLYTPHDSQSSKDRAFLTSHFPDPTVQHFMSYQLPDFGRYADVIVMSKDKNSMESNVFFSELREIDNFIKKSLFVAGYNGSLNYYDDICAIQFEKCTVFGDVVLTKQFERDFLLNNLTFPLYNGSLISPFLASSEFKNGLLLSAKGVKLRYYLRRNTTFSSQWEINFLSKIPEFKTNYTDLSYSTSESLGKELEKNTNGDIQFFSLTFTIMLTYASFASASSFLACNNIANRVLLGFAGVLAPLLAIGSAIGFVSAIGIQFTSIVGVMPFLVIGIGIDDMFILMSGMAEGPSLTTAPSINDRMKYMLKKSGVAITITSITDLLAFAVGATSVFISIRTFCIYTGVAIFFCYLNQLFFFCPAICLNERRTQQKRHFLCCFKISYEDDRSKTSVYKYFCSGTVPKKRQDVESSLEKYPKKFVTQCVLKPAMGKIVIFGFVLAYICSSIYGAINLEQGLSLYNLVSEDSYFHRFSLWDEQFFRTEQVIALCIKEKYNYSSTSTQDKINSILSKAKTLENMDQTFEINWLTAYKSSLLYDISSEQIFIDGLRKFIRNRPEFDNDIIFTEDFSQISSSKVYLKSKDIKSTNIQGALMLSLREYSKLAEISCFFYAPAFIFYEQYVQIWPSTWQTVGAALGVMIVITIIFMPYPLMVIVVSLTLVNILLGIFGFMYYWDLTLSSITMIHLVMSVGFSVDFSVHICHAFLSVRSEDVKNALPKAFDIVGGPVLNAAFSSLLGIAMLGFTKSYIFQSFGKVMFLVIGFGLFHAAFVLPLVLWILFPCYSSRPSKHVKQSYQSDWSQNDVQHPIWISDNHKSIEEISKSLRLCHVSQYPKMKISNEKVISLPIMYSLGNSVGYSYKSINIYCTNNERPCCWGFVERF
nr:patched domain-containing protein 3-like isoform X2 [Crassostrea virginica]XP_022329811.1 patched domain-containing protein 3-like isoform X2 [Crassostrea virginica]